ncbi:MAG TPA: PASTA domain-containing protein, partial [Gryllotalpicola sp.]
KTKDARNALLNHGGLKIYTSLNLNLQQQAQQALSSYIPATMPGIDLGGADVSVELNTGRVVMAVQNRPYNTTNKPQADSTQTAYTFDFNHGGSSGFQTGSTYKAFSLVEWLKEGHALNDVVVAPSVRQQIPQSLYHASCAEPGPGGGPWDVGNDSGGEGGAMTVMDATKHSVNSAFALMGQRLDLCGIRNDAAALGAKPAYPWEQTTNDKGVVVDEVDANGKKVPSYLHDNVSSILGTNFIAPVDMAVAYAGIANGGKSCSAVYIDKVIDSNNKSIPVPQTTCTQAIDPKVAAGVTYALQNGPLLPGGTGAEANPGDGVPIMGKTGTTDAYGQNWLVTSTTKVANAVWVGNVQETQVAPNVWQNIDFRKLYFPGPAGGKAGDHVKFYVDKPILQNLDAAYGGDQFAAPDQMSINGPRTAVPDLTGKSPQEAQTVLQGLGFTYQAGGDQDSDQPQGTVASTNPPSGTQLSRGSVVQVFTSKGNQVKVPNVVGSSLNDAVKTITDAGLKPQASGKGLAPDAKVSAQEPDADSAVSPGDTVKLTVTPAAPGTSSKDGGRNPPVKNDGH